METKDKKEKKNNNGKLAIAAVGAGVLWYLYSRSKIEIVNIDRQNLEVQYKVNIGFKKIEGVIGLTPLQSQQHTFYGRTLKLASNGKFIDLTIVNKKEEVLDTVRVSFTDVIDTSILIGEPTYDTTAPIKIRETNNLSLV